ncbi:MAG: hypothetical protein N2506_00260 [Dehalococcoidales bacterium]|nr:hypothetical protein [Dehalococcoidales bacterium]
MMQHRFNLPGGYVGMLRCVECERMENGEKVRVLNIFSPVRARGHHLSIRTIDDLRKFPEMVLFRGQINGDGSVELTDRRSPVWEK